MRDIDFIPDINKHFITLCLFFFYGCIIIVVIGLLFIKRPTIVEGQVVLYTVQKPVCLYSKSSGVVHYLKNDGVEIIKDEEIAYIENGSDYYQIKKLKNVINNFSEETDWINYKNEIVVDKIGEIKEFFLAFINTLKEVKIQRCYNTDDILKSLIEVDKMERLSIINGYKEVLNLQEKILSQKEEEFIRDSILFEKSAITSETVKQTYFQLLQQREKMMNLKNNINQAEIELLSLDIKVKETNLHNKENEEYGTVKTQFALESLKNAIQSWENKYVLKSSISGILENVYKIEDSQFVREGTEICRVTPKEEGIKSELTFSTINAGKINENALVKIYLNDYSKDDEGYLVGRLEKTAQSIVTNADKSQMWYTGDLRIDFSNQPFFKGDLRFIHGMNGRAEIIVEEKPLILFLLRWLNEVIISLK
ncbi:MAG: hypothetical protein HDS10_05980 [Bacteroides sp.]|nr:hypothetical protein [Bacteroides sp.]